MKRLMKLTMHNAKSIYIEANVMNTLKPNMVAFLSLLFLLFAVVDTATAATDVNLAPVAEPSTSYVSPWAALPFVDGVTITAPVSETGGAVPLMLTQADLSCTGFWGKCGFTRAKDANALVRNLRRASGHTIFTGATPMARLLATK